MRRSMIQGLFLAALLTLLSSLGAQAAPPPDQANPPADYLCAPSVQLRHPQLCPDQGPAAGVEALVRLGLYPPKPLPLAQFDTSNYWIAYSYLKANVGEISIYPTSSAALAGEGSSGLLNKGFIFLTYTDTAQQEIWQTPEGGGDPVLVGTAVAYKTSVGWLRHGQVEPAALSGLHGLVFSKTPERIFGWIREGGTCARKSPGEDGKFTGYCYTLHEVVQVYDQQQVGEWTWYMVGKDTWIEQRQLSLVFPDTRPPEGVSGGKWISINLYEQTIAAYEGGELVFATAASTGRAGWWTQPGTFEVWARLDYDDMTGGVAGDESSGYYLLQRVPWVLYFDQARAIHGTYWHNKFGTPTSRGCVNLSHADARWLYAFSEMGTFVHVFDPSGKTPTDAASYGPGGA